MSLINGKDLDIGDRVAFKAGPGEGRWKLGTIHNLKPVTLPHRDKFYIVVIAQPNQISGGEFYSEYSSLDLEVYKTHFDCASCGQDKQRIEDHYVEEPRGKVDILIEDECYLCDSL